MRTNKLSRSINQGLMERKDDNGDANPAPAITEIKNLLAKQGTAWEEFKSTNDKRLEKLEKGEGVGELDAKLDKISKELDTLAEVRAEVDKLSAKANRPSTDATDPDDITAETKSFNICRRSALTNSPQRDLTVDEYKGYKSAFFSWARKGRLDSLEDNERKAMTAGDDSNGGYLLPFPTIGRIVQKVFELSPIRQIASVQQISTAALEGINDNDESSYGWVGEIAARTNTTTPTVGKSEGFASVVRRRRGGHRGMACREGR